VAAAIVGVLAIVCLLASAIAVWARVTVFNSDKVANVVGDALAEPAVNEAMAAYLAQQVHNAVDLDTVVGEALPSNLDRFQPALVGGIDELVERSLTAVLADERVQDTLTELVRRAHAAAMRLLEGDGLMDGVSVSDGEVTLNLLPLLNRGLLALQEHGFISDVDLPDLSADGDPTAQIAELETSLGRDLPDGLGQLVVYRSENLANAQASLESAQRTVSLAKRAVWVLVALTVVLLAATILLAVNKWRAAFALALGAVAAMVVARAAVERIVDAAPDLVTKPGAKAAVTSMLGDVGQSLLRAFGIVLVLAIGVAVVSVMRRHRQRGDLVAAAAVLTGVLVVGLVGFSLGALVLAIVLGVVCVFALGRWWPATAPTPSA
jgi:hypothetical protein